MPLVQNISEPESSLVAPSATFRHAATGARMIRVSGGTFEMGCDTGSEAERPIHTVCLSPFLVDENPVTNASFARFAEATDYATEAEISGQAWGAVGGEFQMISGLCWKSYFTKDRADHPVVLVTWNDAQAYAAWSGLRLLTEAEFEFCARGGIDGADFPWGNSEPDGSQSPFARPPANLPPTNPVGILGVNPLGIADLAGNVWQWCSDTFSDDYYSKSPMNDPKGPSTEGLKVRRGGAWNVIQSFRLRCSNRGAAKPSSAAPNMGFRCAKSI